MPAPWWSTYFDEDFVRLYRTFLTPERTWEEVMGLLTMLDLPDGARVLDLACGWGRHSVALAAADLRVVGVDLSPVLLERAARLARETEATPTWVRADMRALPFRGAFDAVLSLFSSLGYFGGDEGDLAVLRGAREALRPGGRLLIETMHRDALAREYAHRDWWEGAGGEHVWVEREFDAVAGVSREWTRWRKGEREGEKYHEIRVRSATEWVELLERAGFEPLEWYGDWDRSEFGADSERLIVLSRPAG